MRLKNYRSLLLRALFVVSLSLFTISYVFGLERIRWKVQSGHAGEAFEKPIKKLFEDIKLFLMGK